MIEGQTVSGLHILSRVRPLELDQAGQKRGCVLDLSSPLITPGKIYDVSGKGNHGTIVGATQTRLPSGLPGLSFDGDDYVDCGAGTSLDITGAISFIAWVKCGDPGAATNYHIYEKGRVEVAGQMLRIENGLKLRYLTSQNLAHQATTSVAITANVWQCLGVARSGTSAILYRNGVALSLEVTGTHLDPTSTTKVARVGIGDTLTQGTVGQIDLVRICNQALSPRDFTNVFNQERCLFGV